MLRSVGGRLQRLRDGAARRARKAVSSIFGSGQQRDGACGTESCTTPTRWGGDSGSSPEVDHAERIRNHPIVNLCDRPEFQ